MDSYTLHKMNIFLNTLSLNYLPVESTDDHQRSTVKKSCMVFSWIMIAIFGTSISTAVHFVPREVAIQGDWVLIAVIIECTVVAIDVNARLPSLRIFVTKMQEILIDNDTLKKAISESLDPISAPIKIYVICGLFSSTLWTVFDFLKPLRQDQFTYTDFSIPAYFPSESLDAKSFALVTLVENIACFYAMAKKHAIDVYVTYNIALLAAQYKYLRIALANLLDNGESYSVTIEEQREHEIICENRLKTWIKHHQTVLEISKLLKDLTAIYVFVVFGHCTFVFCLLAFHFISISSTVIEIFIVLLYAGGALSQLYILCDCARELSDSSVSVTTTAFHSEWFMRGERTRKTFCIIMTADKIRCSISAFGIVDLSVTTFTKIINQAYSGCLFLLNSR